MNELIRERILSDLWRKFEKPMSQVNLLGGLEDKVVENLHGTIRKSYWPIMRRYYGLKAKIKSGSGSKLLYTDIFAPVAFDYNWRYSWQEATGIVITAYERFSPEVADICRELLTGGWLRVSGNTGGKMESHHYPVTPKIHPYLSINFQGNDAGVVALAHEFGRSVHLYLSKNNGHLTFRPPLVLSEAVSMFGENLVFDFLKDNTVNTDAKTVFILHRIESLMGAISQNMILLEFENTLYEKRKQRELTSDEIGELWMSILEKNLGDVFELGSDLKHQWAGVLQLFTHPLCGYSRLFSSFLANVLYSRYKKDAKNFKEKYMKLLSSGGNGRCSDLLEPFDINIEGENFWQEGLSILVELIDELEILLKIGGFIE
jgi:oligoendopeptidase F